MVTARNEERLRQARVGIETVRGSAVTPTKRLRERIRLIDSREPLDFEENTGTYDPWWTFEQGVVNVTGTAEGPLSYQDAPYWLLHGIDGEVAGVGDAGSPEAFEWDFTPNPDEDTLASSYMEHGVPDNAYSSEMVMTPSFSIAGDIDGDAAWRFNANLIARNLDTLPAGFTDGIDLADREFVKTAGTKLFIDDDPDDIGTTQFTGRFISFTWEWNNNIAPKKFMEDEDEISTRVGRGARLVTGTVRLEFDNDDERENYRQKVPRAILISRDGDVIHDTVKNSIELHLPRAYWLTPSDDPRENNMTLTFGFRGYVSADVGYPARIVVVNDQADAA